MIKNTPTSASDRANHSDVAVGGGGGSNLDIVGLRYRSGLSGRFFSSVLNFQGLIDFNEANFASHLNVDAVLAVRTAGIYFPTPERGHRRHPLGGIESLQLVGPVTALGSRTQNFCGAGGLIKSNRNQRNQTRAGLKPLGGFRSYQSFVSGPAAPSESYRRAIFSRTILFCMDRGVVKSPEIFKRDRWSAEQISRRNWRKLFFVGGDARKFVAKFRVGGSEDLSQDD